MECPPRGGQAVEGETVRLVVELQLNDLRYIVDEAIAEAFAKPTYGSKGGLGYIMVHKAANEAVKKLVAQLDIVEMVGEAAVRLARGVVDQVVEKELRKMVRESFKKQKAEGILL